MATYITQLPRQVHNDSTYRAFISGTMQAIEACGWVNTGASGTVDTSSVTWRPVTTMNDYVVYQSSGSLQSEAPLFLRLRFNRSSVGTNSTITIVSSIGWRHNNSGSLIGTTETRVIYNPSTDPTGTIGILYAAGDGNYLSLAFSIGLNSSDNRGFLLAVGRSNDITGSYTNQGAYFISGQTATNSQTWFGTLTYEYEATSIIARTAEPNAQNNLPIFIPDDSTSDSTVVNWFSMLSNVGVGMLNFQTGFLPPMNVLYVKRKGISATFDIVDVNVYNKSITYLNVGRFFPMNSILSTEEGSVLLRWE